MVTRLQVKWYKVTGATVQYYRCNGYKDTGAMFTRLHVQPNESEGEMQEIAVDEASASQILPTIFVQCGRLAADQT
jgi:ribosomal protein S18 acetylase RimI-like enzyme